MESVKKISENYPNAEAIVISGSGARTLAITEHLKKISNRPVIAADTALFSIIAKQLDIKVPFVI